jgi:4'-phosphopantetheinyl transferase
VLATGPAGRPRPCGALHCFPLDVPDDEVARLHALLTPDEQARAARFHAARHRQRFAVAHGRLREILGEELGVPPALLRFETAQHGKPMLAGGAGGHLAFNLSHSADRGLLGWARGHELGVDIELWRPLGDEAALVRRFFSVAENAAYGALPVGERTQGFFECWTRKEAYIKAVGRGLGLPLDSFDVAFGTGSVPGLLRPSIHATGRNWTLAAPDVGQRMSAAVVLEGDACHVLPAP